MNHCDRCHQPRPTALLRIVPRPDRPNLLATSCAFCEARESASGREVLEVAALDIGARLATKAALAAIGMWRNRPTHPHA